MALPAAGLGYIFVIFVVSNPVSGVQSTAVKRSVESSKSKPSFLENKRKNLSNCKKCNKA